jgi:hypothetical protein
MFADIVINFQPPLIPLLCKEQPGEISKDFLLSNMVKPNNADIVQKFI